MSAPDLIRGFYGSDGVLVGMQVAGSIVVPFNLVSGIALQDSSGAWWLLQIQTDGRLSTTQVTF